MGCSGSGNSCRLTCTFCRRSASSASAASPRPIYTRIQRPLVLAAQVVAVRRDAVPGVDKVGISAHCVNAALGIVGHDGLRFRPAAIGRYFATPSA
jgi:hypothetical protein